MSDEGHVLMNHTQTHPHMTQLSTPDRLAELEAADAVVAANTGRTMRPWFRPPFGDSDASVLADVALAGYRYSIMWTVDSLGWQGLAPADVTRRCLDRAVDGAIVLMHVGSQSTDARALPDVIAGLRDAGYAFVTVEQLLRP
jgi:peptidoglycan/xylan/chitin deacetylase (PgdA/CDA1 family)